MRAPPRLALAALLAATTDGGAASAFEECAAALADPAALAAFVTERGVHYGPAEFFEAARAIRIETGPEAGGLVPHASFDAAGNPVIRFSTAFPPLLCRVALATFLVIDGDNWRPFAEASLDAARCVDGGGAFDDCLAAFGLDLERRYGGDFIARPPGARSLAYRFFIDAAAQIAVHEYAHHLLDHPRRIGSGALARIDAEFEADLHAILNGAQAGAYVSAMSYFFKALADIESYSDTLGSVDYESGVCRATNVNDITAVLGYVPIAILDAVGGGPGRLRGDPAERIRGIAAELAAEPAPAPSPDACGRLSAGALRALHEELALLAGAVAERADSLAARSTDSAADLALAPEAALPLIRRLAAASPGLRLLGGLAAQAISILIQRVGYAGAEAALAADLAAIEDEVAPKFLARDFGRMLKVRGLVALYGASLPLAPRLAESRRLLKRAVDYHPGLSEGWANLAFIALAEGDCDEAAAHSARAVETAGGEMERRLSTEFEAAMRATIAAGDCAARAASMAAQLARP